MLKATPKNRIVELVNNPIKMHRILRKKKAIEQNQLTKKDLLQISHKWQEKLNIKTNRTQIITIRQMELMPNKKQYNPKQRTNKTAKRTR